MQPLNSFALDFSKNLGHWFDSDSWLFSIYLLNCLLKISIGYGFDYSGARQLVDRRHVLIWSYNGYTKLSVQTLASLASCMTILEGWLGSMDSLIGIKQQKAATCEHITSSSLQESAH